MARLEDRKSVPLQWMAGPSRIQISFKWDMSNPSAVPMQEYGSMHVNTLRHRQNGRHFPGDIFKCIFLNKNVWIKISLKFVPKVRIHNIPALVQLIDWCRPGDKPLSEPLMVRLLMHECITWPQWVNPDCSYSTSSATTREYTILCGCLVLFCSVFPFWGGAVAMYIELFVDSSYIYPYWPGLFLWLWGNHMIIRLLPIQPWSIWIDKLA